MTYAILRLSIPAILAFSVCACAEGLEDRHCDATSETESAGLAESGVDVQVSVTNIYQRNVRGGLDTDNSSGTLTGSYDLELTADMHRILGWPDTIVYAHLEGSWPRSDEDASSVSSAFGANADAAGRRSLDVTELYFERGFLDRTLRLRLGKLDITGGFECCGCPGSFDGNAYANDETSQFLNSALVNNPTIPFPDYGLAALIHYSPEQSWYFSAGMIDAQADRRTSGLTTTFDGDDAFFYIFETGLIRQWDSPRGSMPGAYRVGFWLDPRGKSHSDTQRSYRGDSGLYFSADQLVCRENSRGDDTQGLGLFARYGRTSSLRNDIVEFFSVGFQYQGLLDGRDDDVLGLGYARGSFSDRASVSFVEPAEGVLELYYNASITSRLNISPSIQYISDPGGSSSGDSVLVGVRGQWAF